MFTVELHWRIYGLGFMAWCGVGNFEFIVEAKTKEVHIGI